MKMTEDDTVILDVRTPLEFQQGRIPESVLLDFNSGTFFFEGIQNLDPDKKYLVYCRSGARSAAACAHMSQLGLEAFNLMGGILGWDGPMDR